MASSTARQFLRCSPLLSLGCDECGGNRMERLLIKRQPTLIILRTSTCKSQRKGKYHFTIVNTFGIHYIIKQRTLKKHG